MARGDAYNFPVVREAIGHADALYGFKGGFDRAGADPRRQGRRLLAAQPRARPRRQPPVDGLPLRPRHRQGRPRCVGGNYLTAARTAASAAVSIKHLARKDAKVLGMVGAGHQSAFQMRAAAPPARLRAGDRLEPPPRDALPPRRDRRRGRPALRGRRPRPPRRRGRRHHHHHLLLRPDPEGAPRSSPAPTSPAWAPTPRASRRSRPRSSPRATVFTDEVAQSVTIGEAQHAVAAGLIADVRHHPDRRRHQRRPTPAAARPTRSPSSTAPASACRTSPSPPGSSSSRAAGRQGDRGRRLRRPLRRAVAFPQLCRGRDHCNGYARIGRRARAWQRHPTMAVARRRRPRPPPPLPYRREIDGLRAVAVLPVILFHAGLPAFAGGYLGVDVFFVISGYLITGILAARPRARAASRSPASTSAAPAASCRRSTVVLLACIPFGRRLDVAARSSTSFAREHRRHRALGLQHPLLARARLLRPGRRAPAAAAHLEPRHRGAVLPALPARARRALALAPPAALGRSLAAALAASLGARGLGRRPPPSAGFFLLPFRAWELAARRRARPGAAARRARPARARAALGLAAHRRSRWPRVPLGLLPGILPLVLACAGTAPRHRATPAPAPPASRLLAHPAAGRHRPDQLQRLSLAPADPRLRPHPLRRRAAARGMLGLGAARARCSPGRPGPLSSAVPPARRRLARAGRSLAAGGDPRRAWSPSALAGVATDGLAARKSAGGPGDPRLASPTPTRCRDACKTDLDEPTRSTRSPAAWSTARGRRSPSTATATPTRCRAGCSRRAEAAGFRFYSVTRSACPPIPGLTRTGAAASPACDAFVRGVEAYRRRRPASTSSVLAARWTAGVGPDRLRQRRGRRRGPARRLPDPDRRRPRGRRRPRRRR